jgi:hypothetical protein
MQTINYLEINQFCKIMGALQIHKSFNWNCKWTLISNLKKNYCIKSMHKQHIKSLNILKIPRKWPGCRTLTILTITATHSIYA